MSEFGTAVGFVQPVCDAGSRHLPVPCGGINSTAHPTQSPAGARQISELVSSTVDRATSVYRQTMRATVALSYIRLAASDAVIILCSRVQSRGFRRDVYCAAGTRPHFGHCYPLYL